MREFRAPVSPAIQIALTPTLSWRTGRGSRSTSDCPVAVVQAFEHSLPGAGHGGSIWAVSVAHHCQGKTMVARKLRILARAIIHGIGRSPLILAALCACAIGMMQLSDARADDSHRPVNQIVADIDAASSAFPGYQLGVQLNVQYEAQMERELAGPLQHLVDLYSELEKAQPSAAGNVRVDKCLALVRLALYQHNDALQALTDASKSKVAADAVFGKAGLLMYRWWQAPEQQHQVVRISQRLPRPIPGMICWCPRHWTWPSTTPVPTICPTPCVTLWTTISRARRRCDMSRSPTKSAGRSS
jgi:hypothetical protein